MPTEIRQLDLNAFRLELKDLEDDEAGIVYPATHQHNTTVEVGGVILSRVIEIINGYTITFEDGQYAVNLVGANSNVADVVNVNQVSVRSANSAGLQDLSTLLAAAYNDTVVVDVINGQAGTSTPIGTRSTPVNNIIDAVLIAHKNGLDNMSVIGDVTLTAGDDVTGLHIMGQSKILSTITIDDAAITANCEFTNTRLLGILDGGSSIKDCEVSDLFYVNGYATHCVLNPGTITLGSGTQATFLDCFSGIPGVDTPCIDMGNSGQPLIMRNYSGGICIVNKVGAEDVSIDLESGQVILEDTVVNGLIVVRGNGKLVDERGDAIHTGMWNGVTIVNETPMELLRPIPADTRDLILGTTAFPV